MTSRWNPSQPSNLGLEWIDDDDPSVYVLDAATKGLGVELPLDVTESIASVATYSPTQASQCTLGFDAVALPLIPNLAATATINYPGTDTGKNTNSIRTGSAAWVTNSGSAATYAAVSPGSDDVTYLKNSNASDQAWMLFRGAAATLLSGVRIISVETHVRVRSLMTYTPSVIGYLQMSSVNYPGNRVAIPAGQYNDLVCGQWPTNPRTGLPWTLADVNNLIATGATDAFGGQFTWPAAAADNLRVSQVYLKVRYIPEDRVGYGYSNVTTNGFLAFSSKSVPNLLDAQRTFLLSGTTGWVAGNNTTLTNQADRPSGWSASYGAAQASSSAAGTISIIDTPTAVTPGKIVSCMTAVKSSLVTTHDIVFKDAFSNTLSATQVSAGQAGTGGGTWEMRKGRAYIVPPGAVTAQIQISATATAGSQTFRVTGVVLSLDYVAHAIADIYTIATAPPAGGAEVSAFYKYTSSSRHRFTLRRINGLGTVSIPVIPAGSSIIGNPIDASGAISLLADASGALLGDSPQTFTSPLILSQTGVAIIDSFTRADSASSLGNTDTGQTWTPTVGTWGISSNQAYLPTSGAATNFAVLDLGSGSQVVQFTLAGTPVDGMGITFRFQDSSNYWQVFRSSSFGTWNIYKTISGTPTFVSNTGTTDTNAGAIVRVETNGTTINVYVDGNLGANITDSALQTATKVGILGASTVAGTSARWDNFSAAVGPATLSTDSQPYAQRISGFVDVSNTVTQQITAVAGTWSILRLVVSEAVDPASAGPLFIKLKKVSDNSQVGSTVTINPYDLSVPRQSAQSVVATFSSAPTTTAIQYYYEFTAPSCPGGQGWLVYALDDMGYPFADPLTFGAGVDKWNDPVNGGAQARRNGMILLISPPPVPQGLVATAG